MSHVVIIGCGVIGAAIAYELSQVPNLMVTVLDKQPPAQAATGAALGVLMGVISNKIKGNAWRMRQASIQRYETLIPELEALTGHHIPFNRQGILKLLVPKLSSGNAGDDLANWEQLVKIRSSAGWQLETWDIAQLQSGCPHLNCHNITAGVYSPQDRQVDPVALTLALVEAAQRNGVNFLFGVTVDECYLNATPDNQRLCRQIKITSVEEIDQSPLLDVDWLVVAAGLGSLQLLQKFQKLSQTSTEIVDIRPVLGQAIHLQLKYPLGNPDFQPVITGDDVHIVPIKEGEYWVGATVEFSTNRGEIVANPDRLDEVMQRSLAFCPSLAEATVIKTWSGLRPRPEGRPAPVIGHLQGFKNVLLATGHYRNGVLLAPATAQAIRQIILDF